MGRTLEFDWLNTAEIVEVIHQLKLEQQLQLIQSTAVVRRMLQVGQLSMEQSISGGIHYDGDATLDVYKNQIEAIGEVGISGVGALFIEFGTGLAYESIQHPRANALGVGAGTYPGQGYIFDREDHSWVYNGQAGSHGYTLKNGAILTYGNPPNPIVYKASLDIRRAMRSIIKDTYGTKY